MQIRIDTATPLKLKLAQSSELSDEQIIMLQPGTVIDAEEVSTEHGHLKVSGWIYLGHLTAMVKEPKSKKLSDDDIARAAKAIGCEVATIRALIAVEASGSGFLPDGRPKIRFESHHFARFTDGKFNKSHPHLSTEKWTKSLSIGAVGEYHRMNEATALPHPKAKDAALMSASWGIGQVMGFNFALCGFDSVQDFVAAQYESEGRQLDTMVAFIKAVKGDRALIAKDWAGFARIYNGPGFKANQYDTKLADAYKRFKNES